jgi:hypothetical protein
LFAGGMTTTKKYIPWMLIIVVYVIPRIFVSPHPFFFHTKRRNKQFTMATSPDPKIIDLINEKKSNGILTSLEYFPPRTETGVKVRRRWMLNQLIYYYI